ncbi:hypothetical protein G9A89_011366 [Geosiphon pyriformis]|nr:hypothetical protein G9A89_011366 [Geosiphon pyriformis]
MGFFPSPTNPTLVALLISYTYVSFLLVSAELLHRHGLSLFITRKIIHVGAGTYMLATLYLFDQWQWVVFMMGSFVLFNAIFLYFRIFKSMDPEQGATPGTIYFAFSCAFLIGWFHDGWEEGFPRGREYIATAGIMAMTYGDAFAAIIGKKYGRHGYLLIGDESNRRTIEGSQANFIASFLAISIVWWIMSPPALGGFGNLILGAMVGAVANTGLEAISTYGSDNLIAPIGVSFVLSWLGF